MIPDSAEDDDSEPAEPLEDLTKKKPLYPRKPPPPLPDANFVVNPLTRRMIRKGGVVYRSLVKTGHIDDQTMLAELSKPKTGTRSAAQIDALVEKAVAERMSSSLPGGPLPTGVSSGAVPTPSLPSSIQSPRQGPGRKSSSKGLAKFQKKASKMLAESKEELNQMSEAKAKREVRQRLAQLVLQDDSHQSESQQSESEADSRKLKSVSSLKPKNRGVTAKIVPVDSDSDSESEQSDEEPAPPAIKSEKAERTASAWVPRAIAEYTSKLKTAASPAPVAAREHASRGRQSSAGLPARVLRTAREDNC